MIRQHFFKLPVEAEERFFLLSSFSGALSEFARPFPSRDLSSFLPRKIQNASDRCTDPYLLSNRSHETQTDSRLSTTPELQKRAIRLARKLIRLSRSQFLCARLYASCRTPLFASAREAILFFRQHAEGDQEELCLARALFAAKTSRRFPGDGAVVIGVFLPSRAMHAWVIEGDELADPYDGIWINYQPVAMLS